MSLIRQPFLRLGQADTPLEPLPRFSAALGAGVEVLIKRDDLTGFALGGNKVRKLEFLLAEAQALGADCLVTMGGVQSNHCRQTAAAAAKLGFDCHLVLTAGALSGAEFDEGGNVLLDRLAGAVLHFVGDVADKPAALEAVAEELRAAGRRPYVIPVGGSSPLGSLGYVRAAEELAGQIGPAGVAAVVTTTGSAGTHAGLAAGFAALGLPLRLIGISVSQPTGLVAPRVAELARDVLTLLGCAQVALPEVEVRDGFIGEAYGQVTEGGREALSLLARTEGIYLDPVYTGKTMAGLIAALRAGEFEPGSRVIFLHTGGSPALFAYRGPLLQSL